ncbi:hypothetical protein AVEN_162037-1 [Araneus ventricosus]|uniref:Uncharacterized protein n=1 Tax=Araneus ventricosus TaxID=182803 RepID=A0A4Y2TIC9_ARAVE|nr:hypothetical protein AVEN_162037-1 [Araneus ventricosus]
MTLSSISWSAWLKYDTKSGESTGWFLYNAPCYTHPTLMYILLAIHLPDINSCLSSGLDVHWPSKVPWSHPAAKVVTHGQGTRNNNFQSH